MNFSIEIEIVAAMVIAMLMVYSLEERNAGNRRYRFCLYVSMASIAVDMLSVWGIRNITGIPIWLNVFISSINYLLVNFNSAVIAIYLSYQIFIHFPRHHCKKKIITGISVLYGIIVIAVVHNLFSGCLFLFENGQYIRGHLNLLGYVVLLLEVLMVGFCYIVNKGIASTSMRRAMRTMPYVVCAVVLFQVLNRNVLMNGYFEYIDKSEKA